MYTVQLWEAEFNTEIERANQARVAGNEGKARVCARRAAGIVVGEYLWRRGYSSLSNSAFDRIAMFQNLTDVDEKYKLICRHFLLKVNEEHDLPVKVDLVQEANWLKQGLLGQSKG